MSRRKSQKDSRQIRDIEDQNHILKMEQRNRDLLFLRKMARPIVLAQRSLRIHVPSDALFRHPPHRSVTSYPWIMGKAKDNRSILMGLPFPREEDLLKDFCCYLFVDYSFPAPKL